MLMNDRGGIVVPIFMVGGWVADIFFFIVMIQSIQTHTHRWHALLSCNLFLLLSYIVLSAKLSILAKYMYVCMYICIYIYTANRIDKGKTSID
jgi:Ca2+/Na+ antiporter